MEISSVETTQAHSPADEQPACSGFPSELGAPFGRILFGAAGTPAAIEETEAPECLHDLNLDQVIEQVTAARPDSHLVPFLWALLGDGETIAFRHEVLRNLEAADETTDRQLQHGDGPDADRRSERAAAPRPTAEAHPWAPAFSSQLQAPRSDP